MHAIASARAATSAAAARASLAATRAALSPAASSAHARSYLSRPLVTLDPKFYLGKRDAQPVVCSTPEEAVSSIKSGDRVYVHSVAATPLTLLDALAKRKDELRNVELVHLHLEKANPCEDPALASSFFTNHLFVGAKSRKNVDAGAGSYVPVFLQEAPLLLRSGILSPDVALLNVSPPDRHGFCSLGVEVSVALPAAQAAKVLIAQINPNMPRTHGFSSVHYSAFDYVVEVDEKLPVVAPGKPTAVETAIGKTIASMVKDGATLQMGIGSIPDAVLTELKHHKNLGIHTEMFAEGVIDLIESGVVTNLHKRFLPGKILTSFVMRLYDFVDDNPSVSFMDASVTNDVHFIGSNPAVTAINSAIEVDLTGQVCADSIGKRMVSGVGGQVDFERGAALSQGGLPIICLPSTAKDGSSRIVPVLKEGAGVITTRPHVHYVITEYGAAFLFGKNLIQRAKALIDIAHPNHRAALEKQAFERFNIKTWLN
ncbi:acetyl-CoA hydrolase/transferase family protein [Entophlyctis helioformis]|nr:acetyl-CoA hydrolase/transferase family protein [Entophlyctis helioformis]